MKEVGLPLLVGALLVAAFFAWRDFVRVCSRLDRRQRNWGRR